MSDVGLGTNRSKAHVIANPEDFKLIAFHDKKMQEEKIQEFKMGETKFIDDRDYFKKLWG